MDTKRSRYFSVHFRYRNLFVQQSIRTEKRKLSSLGTHAKQYDVS